MTSSEQERLRKAPTYTESYDAFNDALRYDDDWDAAWQIAYKAGEVSAQPTPAPSDVSVEEVERFLYSEYVRMDATDKGVEATYYLHDLRAFLAGKRLLAAAVTGGPIPMLLFCPECGKQHIDAPEPHVEGCVSFVAPGDCDCNHWANLPHKSHKCHGCGCIWRPCDVPTIGVQRVSIGQHDTWSLSSVPASTPPPAPRSRKMNKLKAAGRFLISIPACAFWGFLFLFVCLWCAVTGEEF